MEMEMEMVKVVVKKITVTIIKTNKVKMVVMMIMQNYSNGK